MPLVAIYARVSAEDQRCDLQLDELREYAGRRQWPVYAEYVDTNISGSKASRPQLNKLMKDASQHRFDTILVWKLDRFGRSVVNFVEQLRSLESYGVAFMCISQAIDTSHSSPTSKLLMHILAAVAEFERSMIQERVKAGMKAAKHRGVYCGRRRNIWDREERFSMAVLALNTSSYRNAVSRLHRTVSQEMFQDLWPQLPVWEVPVTSITATVAPGTRRTVARRGAGVAAGQRGRRRRSVYAENQPAYFCWSSGSRQSSPRTTPRHDAVPQLQSNSS